MDESYPTRMGERTENSDDKHALMRTGEPDDKGQLQHAPAPELRVADLLTEREQRVHELHTVSRLDVRECARIAGLKPSQVVRILARIRTKYAKHGQLLLATPNAEHAHTTRTRYDSILVELRRDFERVEPDMHALRSRLAKTIADIERMRDDALLAFGVGAPSTQGSTSFVYVSHLRANGDEENSPHPVRVRGD